MSKTKLKTLGVKMRTAALNVADFVERGLRRFYATARRKFDPPVRVYRKKDVLTIVDAMRIGGRVQIANVASKHTLIKVSEDVPALIIGDATLPYGDVATAALALERVKRALLPTGWGTWALRAAGMLVVFVVVRGALTGMAPVGDAQAQTPEGGLTGMAAAMASNPSFVPPDPVAQSMPGAEPVGGGLADHIYQQAMAAAQQAGHEAMPPQPAATSEGLEGFGLESDQGKNGAGCDPGLAFEVKD